MTLVPVSIDTIRGTRSKWAKCKALNAIIQFMESDMEAARIDYKEGEYANAKSVQTTYSSAIRKLKVNCVCCIRDGEAYLCKVAASVNTYKIRQ